MRAVDQPNHVTTLRDHLRVIRRRKWVILLALLVVPAAAVAYSLHQSPLYRATSQVLLSHQNLAATLTGTPDPSVYLQADRVAQTQADLARTPEVARRTIHAAGIHRSADSFLNSSTADVRQNADILELSVTDGDRLRARRLAGAYAHAYTAYKQQLDTAAIERARREVQARLTQLALAGSTKSPLYADLADNEQKLRTMEALVTSNASVVRASDRPERIRPRPYLFGGLGLAFALVLGLGLAFLWEALDTRIRTGEQVRDLLDLPLLARLPEPPRKLRKADRLVMLVTPRGPQAEHFRMLRTNLDFMRLGKHVKTIMVTSSVEQEGKSTTVANLAVALARAGERVALIDLDLRRPFIDRFFDLRFRPGLTQVALGHATLAEALIPIAISDDEDEGHHVVGLSSWNGNGTGRHRNGFVRPGGELQVLIAGPMPPNPGEFVGSDALGDILADLRDQFDVVLVDAPPALQVGDAHALTSRVDAMFVIARLGVVRRPMLSELRRMLDHCRAAKLGFILTDAGTEEDYAYQGYYYGAYDKEPEKEHVA